MKKSRIFTSTIAYMSLVMLLCGCSGALPDDYLPTSNPGDSTTVTEPGSDNAGQSDKPGNTDTISKEKGTWDNTIVVLAPEADGTAANRNDVAVIDYSHSDLGYICATYTGSVEKVKLRVTGPDKENYTYDMQPNICSTYPLSTGDGEYEITIFENISGTSYSTCLYQKINVTISDEFAPFLYPNHYVNFSADCDTVKKGAELAMSADCALDVITNVYNYVTSNISYDHTKAEDPPTGYVSDVDEILHSKTGICLDYAAVMTSMLRSQRIPTRLEVGYAQDAYHAWISVYTEETGWLNDIYQFDGTRWTLVDPTFGANSSNRSLKKFIGDGTNYTLKKVY